MSHSDLENIIDSLTKVTKTSDMFEGSRLQKIARSRLHHFIETNLTEEQKSFVNKLLSASGTDLSKDLPDSQWRLEAKNLLDISNLLKEKLAPAANSKPLNVTIAKKRTNKTSRDPLTRDQLITLILGAPTLVASIWGAIALIDFSFFRTKTKLPLSEGGYSVAVSFEENWIATGGQYAESPGYVDIYSKKTGETERSQLSQARNSMGVARVNDQIFFVGGINPTTGQSDLIDIFDFKSKSWKTMRLPYDMVGPEAIGIDDFLVIAGGSNQQLGALNNIETIDTVTQSKKTALLSTPRSGLASASDGRYAYFIGGMSCFNVPPCEPSNTIDVYDPKTNLVQTIEMPRKRLHGKALVYNDKIYISGGSDGKEDSPYLDIYNLKTKEWKSIGISPPGSGTSITRLSNLIILAGGTNGSKLIQVFDASKDKISSVKEMKVSRYNLASATSTNMIFLIGGVTEIGGSKEAEIYTVEELKK